MRATANKLGRARITEDPKGVGEPTVPANLNEEQAKLFRHCLGSLPPEILTSADEAMLEGFAVAWARFRQADDQILRTGLLVQSPSGPIRNPLLIVSEKSADLIHKLGGQLGLSPVARARLTTVSAGEEDPMAQLLGDDLDPTGAWSTPPRTKAN